jgi:hypothetical protein
MESVTLHNYREPKLARGVAAAIVSGLVGMGGWYLIVDLTQHEIGYAAWGVGVLVGFLTRKLAGNGNVTLGIVAAGSALLAIIGGQYLVTTHALEKYATEQARLAYDARMAFAREAVGAQSDEQLQVLLARYGTNEEGAALDSNAISAEQVARFRAEGLPRLREFVEGKPTREESERAMVEEFKASIPQLAVLKASVSVWTLLWLVLGVGSAYKLAAANEKAAPSAGDKRVDVAQRPQQ